MSAYTPPHASERRSAWVMAFEFILLWLVFGAILAVSFAGAVLIQPALP